MKAKISCIIPAYNEASRIGNVLKVVESHPLLDEIIVVDDGSRDKTREVVKNFKRVKLIVHKKNKGKTGAVITGIKACNGDFIMLIDSDLRGLRRQDVTNLIKPVIENKAQMSISLRKNTGILQKLIGIDFISGERVFHKSFFENFKELNNVTGYQIESSMNDRIIDKKMTIKVVAWNNVESPWPSERFGFFKGTIKLVKMTLEIYKRNGIRGYFYQVYKMHALKV